MPSALANLYTGLGAVGAGFPAHRGIRRTKFRDGAVGFRSIQDSLYDGSFYYDDCSEIVGVRTAVNSYGAPTGATGDVNRVNFKSGLFADVHVKGTQTLLAPLRDDTFGIDISQDQTDNDGVEYIFGGNAANNKLAIVTGTTESAFLYARIRIADVSGTDDLCIGWRKQETNQANVDDYTEAAWVNINLGAAQAETIVANAATTTTALTNAVADGDTVSIYVEVASSRAVTMLINGNRFTTRPPAFSFAAGITLVPFIFFLQATTSPGKVFFRELAMGRKSAINADLSNNE